MDEIKKFENGLVSDAEWWITRGSEMPDDTPLLVHLVSTLCGNLPKFSTKRSEYIAQMREVGALYRASTKSARSAARLFLKHIREDVERESSLSSGGES